MRFRKDGGFELGFSTSERDLVLNHVRSDDWIAEQLRGKGASIGDHHVVSARHADLTEFLEALAAEANQRDDAAL